MRKIFLAGFCLLIGLQAISQTTFSPVVKKFIDYDTPVIAFTHCRLADVKHLKVLEDQTVIVRNGIITAMGDSKKLSAPAGSTVIDLTGKSLLPGFVLLHEHMFYAAYSADFTYLHVKQLPYTFPKLYQMFSDAGGLLTVGTDPTGSGATLAGYGSQQSIELLTQAGFSPIEAIRIATYNGAKALGLDNKIGSIEVGKAADLVVIDGDISQDIQNIRKIVWVFKQGVGFNSQKIFSSVKGEVGKY
jgi:imidazolonepropionase-like amidohydrolase